MNDKDDTEHKSDDSAASAPEAVEPETKAEPIVPIEHDEHEHEHDDEEHHVSLAARSLQILALLVLGGVMALWLGPRIAPNLPKGMGAVAQWLAPGASLAEEQVAELRAEFAASQAAQSPQLDLAAIDARIAAADTTTALHEELATLSQRVETVEAAPGALTTRLDSLESRLTGTEAMLTSIDEALRNLVTTGLALDSQAAADITAYGATIDGLRARLADLDARLGEQAARIDAVTAEIRSEAQTAVQSAAAAQANSEQQAALIALEAALTDGLPYRGTLDWIASTQRQTVPPALVAQADSGVTSLASLRDLFPALAHEAIRTDIRQSSDESALGQFGAFLQSQVASRSLTPQQGTSTDAILSRAEAALRQDDLGQALRHMRTVSVPAAEIYADWVALAQARQSAMDGFEVLKSALSGAAQ